MSDYLWGFYPGTYARLLVANRDLEAVNKTLKLLYRLLEDSQASLSADPDHQISAVQKWIQEAGRRKAHAEATIHICNEEIRSGKTTESYQQFR